VNRTFNLTVEMRAPYYWAIAARCLNADVF